MPSRTPPRSQDTTTMRMPPSIRIESPSRRPRISIARQTISQGESAAFRRRSEISLVAATYDCCTRIMLTSSSSVLTPLTDCRRASPCSASVRVDGRVVLGGLGLDAQRGDRAPKEAEKAARDDSAAGRGVADRVGCRSQRAEGQRDGVVGGRIRRRRWPRSSKGHRQ